MILNVTQPIAMFVSVTLANLYGSGGGIRQRNWFVASIRSRGIIALLMYLLLLIGDSGELWQSSDDITPEVKVGTWFLEIGLPALLWIRMWLSHAKEMHV